MFPAGVHYREFAPCEALRKHVRAFFSFGPAAAHPPGARSITLDIRLGAGNPIFTPVLADGHVSVVFNFEQACSSDWRWRRASSAARAEVIGPIRAVTPASGDEQPEAVGVFLRAGCARAFTVAPAVELADRAVALNDLWGAEAARLLAELGGDGEAARIDRLESVLLRRLAHAPAEGSPLNVAGLARWVLRERGRVRIEQLAEASGVSRQHLTRTFRETAGITPKLYARLARFQAGLAYAGCGTKVDWAQAALELGYADQSHMIADFREFSSLTPEALARQPWFHPFIERARAAGLR